jgi:hypothetical protein
MRRGTSLDNGSRPSDLSLVLWTANGSYSDFQGSATHPHRHRNKENGWSSPRVYQTPDVLWPNAMSNDLQLASSTSTGPRFLHAKNEYSSSARSLHLSSYLARVYPGAAIVLTFHNSVPRMRHPHTTCHRGSRCSLSESSATFNVLRSNLGGVLISQSWDVFHDSPSVSSYARAPCR